MPYRRDIPTPPATNGYMTSKGLPLSLHHNIRAYMHVAVQPATSLRHCESLICSCCLEGRRGHFRLSPIRGMNRRTFEPRAQIRHRNCREIGRREPCFRRRLARAARAKVRDHHAGCVADQMLLQVPSSAESLECLRHIYCSSTRSGLATPTLCSSETCG